MCFIKKIACLSLLSVIGLAILSCASGHHLKGDVSYKNPNFTFSNLKNDGLYICGFSSKVVELSTLMRLNYSTILTNSLLKNLKDTRKVSLTNTSEVIKKIGRESYIELMESFDLNRKLKTEEIQIFKKSMPEARYLLIAYIENENVIDHSYEEYVESYEGDEEIETEYEKIYLLSVEFSIIDLAEEKPVLTNTIFNEAVRSETRTTRTGCFESCVDNLIQDILFGEAAEIDRAEVIEVISKKFAKTLSKI